jgi:curved DNA-binding protein CbpA
MEKTHYQVLGLESTAPADAIRQRFRELARQCHPDVAGDGHANHWTFARIIEAYQLLIDPKRREQYDRELQRSTDGGLTPEMLVGSRLEVRHAGEMLVCSVREVRTDMLYLAAPAGARRLSAIEGARVTLTCYRAGRCLETETRAGQWVWMPTVSGARCQGNRQPGTGNRVPLTGGFWVGPLGAWHENARRRSRRVPYQLPVRLSVDGGSDLEGQSQDVSAAGLSLIVNGAAEISEGATGRISLQIGERIWTQVMPVRVVRVRNWLQPSRRTMEIAVQLQPESRCRLWLEHLARLGVEE